MTLQPGKKHMTRLSIKDRLAISDLFVRYTTALDGGDVEAVVACFSEDGWLDSPIVGRHQGREELRQFAEKTAAAVRQGARFRHMITNLRVAAQDDRIRARCYLLDIVTINGETQILSPGEYDCEVVRRGKAWLFASRLVQMDRVFSMPFS
jgi:uncharacterized protein (TIGR02246 family)